MIKTIPAKFRAGDGAEFDNNADATKHQALLEAMDAYKEAQQRFGRLLVESQKTADGQAFDLARSRPYFCIVDSYWNRPDIKEVSFWPYHCAFDVNNGLNFKYEEQGKWKTYVVGELYADKVAAQVALLAAQREWLKRQSDIVDALAQVVEPQSRELTDKPQG